MYNMLYFSFIKNIKKLKKKTLNEDKIKILAFGQQCCVDNQSKSF